jgi:hypothetical protein
MTTHLRKIVPLIVLLALALGCKFFNQIQKKVEEDQKPKVMTSTDGKCQLTVPRNWSVQKDLNDDAVIQAGNLRAEQYAVVISDTKVDFTDEMNLLGITELVRNGLAETVPDPIFSENKPVTVNGYSALQFEVSGSVDKIRARWIYTIVDSPKNFHQIIAWSLASKYEANKPVFLEVINSFRETEGSIELPPPAAP